MINKEDSHKEKPAPVLPTLLDSQPVYTPHVCDCGAKVCDCEKPKNQVTDQRKCACDEDYIQDSQKRCWHCLQIINYKSPLYYDIDYGEMAATCPRTGAIVHLRCI